MIFTDGLINSYYSSTKLSSVIHYVSNFIGNLITDRFTDRKGTSNKKKIMFYFIDEYNKSPKRKTICISVDFFLIKPTELNLW